MLPNSTIQQTAPTHTKNHQCNVFNTDRYPRHTETLFFPPEIATNPPSHTRCSSAMPVASQQHFAALSHWHSVTALALQTLRARVCTGTAPTNRGFGFIGLFCLGSGERNQQFFLYWYFGQEL